MNKQRLPKEIKQENIKDLEKDFKKVYVCSECKMSYGSDLKKEKEPFLCPFCDQNEKPLKFI